MRGGTKIAISVFLFVCTLVFLVYLLICLFVRLVCISANPIKIRACSFGLEIIVIILITPSESIFKIIRKNVLNFNIFLIFRKMYSAALHYHQEILNYL